MSNAIDPIINQIQRELLLVIEYLPNEPLQVKMTRKRSFKYDEDQEREIVNDNNSQKETSYTIAPHNKSKKTNLHVIFPDGLEVSNRFAYQTLCDVIELVGIDRVISLNIIHAGIPLVSKTEDDFYTQHKIKDDYLVITHTSTATKKQQIEEISRQLNLNLEVNILK